MMINQLSSYLSQQDQQHFKLVDLQIYSAFLLHDNFKSKPSWEKRSQMQLKLEYMMLSITDEISMVGFKQFQSVNQTMCTLKGTTDGNWGDICVPAVGNLYQLLPVGQCPIYMSPQIVHTLNDIVPNGWEKMQLHELTQSMRQKDMKFVNCLNKIHTTVPLEGSEEDRMLQTCELNLIPVMKTIHMMQCMFMQKMCTVMHGMNTDSNCFLEDNLQI